MSGCLKGCGVILIISVVIGIVFALSSRSDEPTSVLEALVNSGGLGLSRSEWEKEHGEGEDGGLIAYEDKTFLVAYGDNGNIVNLSWNLPAPVANLKDAQAIARTKLPGDASFVSTGFDDFGNVRDYYVSDSLAARFDADNPFWGTGGPGSCFVTYYAATNGATNEATESLLIAIGDK